ncbi:MAG: divalent-cation tolerance protein CutA [Terriglobales bacterium]
MTEPRVVLTTCSSLEEARHIARALVEQQLAACVNLVPQVESMYRWKGEVETSTEVLLVIKTTAGAFERLQAVVLKLHSYEVPECLELTVTDGSKAYLNWIGESVR